MKYLGYQMATPEGDTF